MSNYQVQTFILLGQGGSWTSGGMLALQKPLSQFGPVTVSAWDDRGMISRYLNSHVGVGRVALIGYSLGANQIPYIMQQTIRRVQLAVGYDASRMSPLTTIRDGIPSQQITNVDRAICYYNPSTWFFGGARWIGQNVETVQVSATHLGIQYQSELHEHTINAVREVASNHVARPA
jgi:hypothetical protein